MSTGNIKIVLLQTGICWENARENLSRLAQILDAIKSNPHLVVLPEMFSTGFTTNVKTCAEEMNGPSMAFLKGYAHRLNCCLTGSILIREQGLFYNRLVCMYPDGRFLTYDKRHLFKLSNEYKIMTAGNRRVIADLGEWSFLPLVCYDIRFPVWSKNTFTNGKHEYDLLVYPSNWPQSRAYAWKSLLIARAIENQCYVIGVNRIGEDGCGTRHSGGSLVIGPKGDIIAEGENREEVIEATLSMTELISYRNSFSIGPDWDRFTIEI